MSINIPKADFSNKKIIEFKLILFKSLYMLFMTGNNDISCFIEQR
jgi:hypothetical protein